MLFIQMNLRKKYSLQENWDGGSRSLFSSALRIHKDDESAKSLSDHPT